MERLRISNNFIYVDRDYSLVDEGDVYMGGINVGEKSPGMACSVIKNVETDFFIKNIFSTHEMDAYKRLENTNITPKYIGCCENYFGFYIILEKMEKLTLKRFNENFYNYLVKVLDKLEAMHSLDIIHRDIKLDNLLIKNDDVYFIDFEDKGFSLEYSCKEVFSFKFSKESDIYALGCTLINIITCDYPWSGCEDFEEKIMEEDYAELLKPVKGHKMYKFIENCIVNKKIDRLLI